VGLAVQVVVDLCRALAYAHALTDEQQRPLGLVHRDVTPANVMLGKEGVVKLLDFGIAKALNAADENTKSGAIHGKMGYLAPETVEGRSADHRVDLFSVGVILHEMLVGRRLFRGEDDIQTLAKVRECAIPPPSAARDDVPPELERFCLRALARDPDARYGSAGEMERELRPLMHQLQWTASDTAAFLTRETVERPKPIIDSTRKAAARPETTKARRPWAALALLSGVLVALGWWGYSHRAQVVPPAPAAAINVAPAPAAAIKVPPAPAAAINVAPAVTAAPVTPPAETRHPGKPRKKAKKGIDLLRGDVAEQL
jgi:serine/threonine protein kinase